MAGSYYIPLPSPEVPQNALLNFAPVNNALDTYREQKNTDFRNSLAQKESDRQDQELGLRKQQFAQSSHLAQIKRGGDMAMAIQNMADNDPAKAVAWQRYLKEFGDGNHSPEEMDFRTGPKIAAAAAGQYLDPIKKQLEQAQLNNINSEIASRSKPQFTTVGHDAYGQPTYGFVNPQTMKVTPAEGQQQAAAGPNPSATGDQYLASLPQNIATQVKAIAEGRLPLPGGFALKTPYWQQMMAHVSQYDPSFDAVNYGARSKTRADFAAGKSAQNVTSFNTAIGHIDTLDKTVDQLGNTNYPMLNKVRNAVRAQADPAYQNASKQFNAAKQAVVDELTRAFRGSGGNVHDIKGWEETINNADSPAALHTATRQAIELLRSRIESVGDQYNRGMGTTKDPIDLLSPKAKHALERIEGQGNGPSQGPSAIPQSKEEYDALPSGTHYVAPDGSERIKP